MKMDEYDIKEVRKLEDMHKKKMDTAHVIKQ